MLDLCLECKACKSECPTNVDMARLKAEVLDQHYKKHGLPWRNWLFGNVGRWYRLGTASSPRLFNWLTQGRLARRLNEVAFGIDQPADTAGACAAGAFAKRNEEVYWDESVHDPTKFVWQALLFPDTFMNYCEPQLGEGVRYLLASAGLGVNSPVREEVGSDHLTCCGRPFISNGMLDQAMAVATQNVERLYEGDMPIVACEPSCILTIKDDYPALLKGDLREKAKAVSARCFTFEEFLEKRLAETTIEFRPGPKRILVQGHCHQRSLVGMAPTIKLLKRIPGAEVIDLDAGCCGMAGSFGYEKEHYEISRMVGEQRLFPAIREADADTVIVAPGFSCRLQIEHFTGRTALHPATLLQLLLTRPTPEPIAMPPTIRFSSLCLCALWLTPFVNADWPHMRGPAYDAVSAERDLADAWPSDGPPRLWTRELGQGYSGFIVADGKLFTQRQTLGGQFLVCLDPDSGETIWEYRYDWAWQPKGAYPGPYSSPTWHNGKVFYASTNSTVGCVDGKTGSSVWSINIKEKFKGRGFDFGYARRRRSSRTTR